MIQSPGPPSNPQFTWGPRPRLVLCQKGGRLSTPLMAPALCWARIDQLSMALSWWIWPLHHIWNGSTRLSPLHLLHLLAALAVYPAVPPFMTRTTQWRSTSLSRRMLHLSSLAVWLAHHLRKNFQPYTPVRESMWSIWAFLHGLCARGCDDNINWLLTSLLDIVTIDIHNCSWFVTFLSI